MPPSGWRRTSTDVPGRGGALVTGFSLGDDTIARQLDTVVSDTQLWESLEYSLQRVVPVAEAAGVRLAMHPDDPPLSPLAGESRIMRSLENYQRLLDLVPSPVNGIGMCLGNFALMTDDLPAAIREFSAQGKIFFTHLRNVVGTADEFRETFHDEGQTDLLACMQAFRDIGYHGVLCPGHVPTMAGDSDDDPGYSSIGSLFAVRYLRGLHEAVDGRTAT